jgi:integrase
MMSLYKKSNSPYYWFDVRYLGTRHRGSTGTANKSAATKYESAIVNSLHNGTYNAVQSTSATNSKTQGVTLGNALNKHKQAIWGMAKSYDSFYCINIRAICTDSISELDVCYLSTNDLLTWQADKLAYGNARSTLNQKLGIIRQVLDRVKRIDNLMLPVIDWDIIKLKKAGNPHSVWFTNDDEQRIQDYYRERGHYDVADLFIISSETGARFSNVTGLLWSDIDLKKRTVTYRNTKNGTDVRLPLTNRAHEVLAGRTHLVSPFVGIEYDRVRKLWERMRKQFGWPSGEGYKIHALRHTCGTRLANAGVDIRIIQEWLGHKDLRQTSKYVQVISERLEHARDALQNNTK